MRKVALLMFALLLAACQPGVTREITPAAPLAVNVSDSLAWLESDLADCAATAGVAVQRSETSANAALTLRLGEPDGQGYAAVLGEDRLAVIVHPDNPLEEISAQAVQAIFSGGEQSWPEGGEIQVWALPQSSDVTTAFVAAGFAIADAGLAPTTGAMRKAVAADPSAIGYLPARWLDSSVRALTVSGLEIDLPILAISAQEPQGEARALLLCLQERIGD